MHLHAHMHARTHTCMHACVCVCLPVCLCVYACTDACMHLYVCCHKILTGALIEASRALIGSLAMHTHLSHAIYTRVHLSYLHTCLQELSFKRDELADRMRWAIRNDVTVRREERHICCMRAGAVDVETHMLHMLCAGRWATPRGRCKKGNRTTTWSARLQRLARRCE